MEEEGERSHCGCEVGCENAEEALHKDPDGLSEKSDSPLEVRHLGHLSHPAASFGNKKREAA